MPIPFTDDQAVPRAARLAQEAAREAYNARHSYISSLMNLDASVRGGLTPAHRLPQEVEVRRTFARLLTADAEASLALGTLYATIRHS